MLKKIPHQRSHQLLSIPATVVNGVHSSPALQKLLHALIISNKGRNVELCAT